MLHTPARIQVYLDLLDSEEAGLHQWLPIQHSPRYGEDANPSRMAPGFRRQIKQRIFSTFLAVAPPKRKERSTSLRTNLGKDHFRNVYIYMYVYIYICIYIYVYQFLFESGGNWILPVFVCVFRKVFQVDGYHFSHIENFLCFPRCSHGGSSPRCFWWKIVEKNGQKNPNEPRQWPYGTIKYTTGNLTLRLFQHTFGTHP